MPLPKRKHSRQRSRKRRTHYVMKLPGLGRCPQCQEIKAPPRVCSHCGYYKGTEVVAAKEEV